MRQVAYPGISDEGRGRRRMRERERNTSFFSESQK
jgi:hypothetical protein